MHTPSADRPRRGDPTPQQANRADALVAAQLAAGKRPNRLLAEKSPYLLQHAFNPVDWFAWGDEAFAAARESGRPIFLSVGYATCHWCHVMERESFEDTTIAALMNAHYVNIKIDREERPDVDRIYMTVVQAMTGNGGWPMSVFLTPMLQPFYAGTYYPPRGAYGRPGFRELLEQIAGQWQADRDRIEQSAGRIVASIEQAVERSSAAGGADGEAGEAADAEPATVAAGAAAHPLLEGAVAELTASFDPERGGFGQAPKFPRPAVFQALLLHHAIARPPAGTTAPAGNALEMALATLHAMAAGGMYDHLGGGFHRYSVDAHWRVPHFEKMLYDQAQLVDAYTAAYRATGDPALRASAEDTLGYVLRDLRAPEGGYYSAEDADSEEDPASGHEKVEGGFYMWTVEQVREALAPDGDVDAFEREYGIEPEGNTLADPHGELGVRNVLYRDPAAAAPVPMPDRWRAPLRTARDRRPRPLLDDKVIASWNGMTIGALADASRAFGVPEYLDAARAAARFVQRHLIGSDGAVLRRYRDGEAKYDGGLADYGALIDGLVRCYEAGGDGDALSSAVAMVPWMLDRFVDDDGRMHDTPADAADLVLRTRELYDSAEASGTTLACQGLLRLARLLGHEEWLVSVRRALRHAVAEVAGHPGAAPQLAAVADLARRPPTELVLVGPWLQTEPFRDEVGRRFMPGLSVVHAFDEPTAQWLSSWLPAIPEMYAAAAGDVRAYLCHGFVCESPVVDPGELGEQLDAAPLAISATIAD